MTDIIPIAEAQDIAERHGLQQVVIVARRTGESGREFVVTYGVDMENSAVAAHLGEFLRHEIMGWRENVMEGKVGERVRLARLAPKMLECLKAMIEVDEMDFTSPDILDKDEDAWALAREIVSEAEGTLRMTEPENCGWPHYSECQHEREKPAAQRRLERAAPKMLAELKAWAEGFDSFGDEREGPMTVLGRRVQSTQAIIAEAEVEDE